MDSRREARGEKAEELSLYEMLELPFERAVMFRTSSYPSRVSLLLWQPIQKGASGWAFSLE